jgi:hypothetical protein
LKTPTHLEGPKMLLSPVASLQKLVLMLMVEEGTRTFGEKPGILTKFDCLLVTTMTCIFFIRAFIPSLRLSNKVSEYWMSLHRQII